MPNWLAIPYDESEREAVMSMYKGVPYPIHQPYQHTLSTHPLIPYPTYPLTPHTVVKGIPRLLVLAPNGNILCNNAVQEPLSMDLVDQWIRLGLGKRT